MMDEFLGKLSPLIDFIATLDPLDSKAAELLNERFPVDGQALAEIAALFEEGVRNGWLCDRDGGPTVSYSRVRKATSDTELSIDAVRMNGKGPGHTHPDGEFDLCLAVEGDPSFDGNPPGFTVYPPGSWHEPTVTGGTMNILYFLPGGAIRFEPGP